MPKRWIRSLANMSILVIALLAAGACTDLAFGGGGAGGDGANMGSSSVTGLSAGQVTAAFGHQAVPAGGTVNLGGSPPPATGAHQGTQWTGLNGIPSGLPKIPRRVSLANDMASDAAESQKQIKKSNQMLAAENTAQLVSLGCSAVNGILSLGATTLTTEATKLLATKILIYGLTYDGLTSAVGAYTESHLAGNSASKSLLVASSNGAAKVMTTVALGKLGPASKVGNSMFQTIGGMFYDVIAGSPEATNLGPMVPIDPGNPVAAPLSTPKMVHSPVQNAY